MWDMGDLHIASNESSMRAERELRRQSTDLPRARPLLSALSCPIAMPAGASAASAGHGFASSGLPDDEGFGFGSGSPSTSPSGHAVLSALQFNPRAVQVALSRSLKVQPPALVKTAGNACTALSTSAPSTGSFIVPMRIAAAATTFE